jgi:hypothetical protein
MIRENWGEESFELKDGAMNNTFAIVPAGGSANLNFTLVPKQFGEMSGFRGIASFKTSADGETFVRVDVYANAVLIAVGLQIVFSTPMVPHIVYTAEAYHRATASRWVQGFCTCG